VSVHEKFSLAAAISDYFEKRAEEAPQDLNTRATPSRDSIHGMLSACESQTAAYDWTNQLLGIAAKLEISGSMASSTIPRSVLQGLITMLPMAQHFPEDHYIIVETPTGICSIVAWAFMLLGLSVLVRIHTDDAHRDIRFGGEQEQVFVNVRQDYSDSRRTYRKDPSIALLSSSAGEELIKLHSDADEDKLDGTHKSPVCGFAHRMLENSIPPRDHAAVAMREMKFIVCSFAICIAKRLCTIVETGRPLPPVTLEVERFAAHSNKGKLHEGGSLPEYAPPKPLPHAIQHRKILEAAQMLFDDNSLALGTIEQYAALYSGVKFTDAKPPSALRSVLREWSNDSEGDAGPEVVDGIFFALQSVAVSIAVLVLAFAHVADPWAIRDLPLCQGSIIVRSKIYKAAKAWDGTSALVIAGDVWLELLASLVIGVESDATNVDATGLVSNRGWSVFVNTFGEPDPAYAGELSFFYCLTRLSVVIPGTYSNLLHRTWQGCG
jgi:hypothetical protein